MNEKDIGKRVIAKLATGGEHSRGTIVAYHPGPAYIIERDEGSQHQDLRFTWLEDLCEVQEVTTRDAFKRLEGELELVYDGVNIGVGPEAGKSLVAIMRAYEAWIKACEWG